MTNENGRDPLESSVFIQGLHRSGTTVLYQMLSESECFNSVWAWHVIRVDEIEAGCDDFVESQERLQREFDRQGIDSRPDPMKVHPRMMEEYGFILENRGFGMRLTQQSVPELRHVCDRIRNTQNCELPMLLKNPWDFANGHQIKEWLPSAKFVYIHRDPVSCISSLWRFAKKLVMTPWPYMSMLSNRYGRIVQSTPKLRALQTIVRRWPKLFLGLIIGHTVRQCKRYLRTIELLPKSDHISITYDELCRAPNETIGSILNHLGVTGRPIDYRKTINQRKATIDPLVASERTRIRRKLADYLAVVNV